MRFTLSPRRQRLLAALLAAVCLAGGALFALRAALPDTFYIAEGEELRIASMPFLTARQDKGPVAEAGGINADKSRNTTLTLLGVIPVKTVRTVTAARRTVEASGTPFGVKMFSNGALVVAFSDLYTARGSENPAKEAGLRLGDLITAKQGKSMEPAIQILRELAREYPVYYGNGNHEHRLRLYPKTYGNMAVKYGQALKELGIRPLANRHVDLAEYGLSIYGVEIGREFYRKFRVPKMPDGYLGRLLGKAPADRCTVLLAHNPDYFPKYAAWGADLVLSGHVHGGVVRIPFLGKGVLSPAWRLFPKYDGGVFREGKSTMVLSRGLGMHTICIRLFNPGELWVVDFVPGKQGGRAEGEESGGAEG